MWVFDVLILEDALWDNVCTQATETPKRSIRASVNSLVDQSNQSLLQGKAFLFHNSQGMRD